MGFTPPTDATSTTELTAGGVISRVLEIYREQWQTLLLAALAVYAVNLVAGFLFTGVLVVLALVVSVAVGVFFQGMVVELVRDLQDGRRDSSIGELFASVGPVALPLFLASLLAGLGIALGFVLLIVPGLILLTFWALIAPVVVIENPGVLRAFGRSRELVSGHGWTVFGVIAIVFGLTIAVFIVAGIFAAALGSVGGAIVSWLASALVAPVGALAASVLYFRLAGPAPAVGTQSGLAGL